MAIVFEIPKTPGFSKRSASKWLTTVAELEGASVQRLHFKSFTSSDMIALNTQFLNHDYDTDIITFSVTEHPLPIESDFALGWSQIQKQAIEWNEPFIRELHRIVVHGLLHCIGYNDHTDEEQKVIRSKEDYYLSIHPERSTWNI